MTASLFTSLDSPKTYIDSTSSNSFLAPLVHGEGRRSLEQLKSSLSRPGHPTHHSCNGSPMGTGPGVPPHERLDNPTRRSYDVQ